MFLWFFASSRLIKETKGSHFFQKDGATIYEKTRMWSNTNIFRILTNETEVKMVLNLVTQLGYVVICLLITCQILFLGWVLEQSVSI